MNPRRCPGRGVERDPCDGATHRYLESSVACWARYGELLAREYSDPRYMVVHRLTVDAYAVQHPGTPSPQSIQSVAVHLISLYAVFERGATPAQATALIRRSADAGGFFRLAPPPARGALTVLHAFAARSPQEHAACVGGWARCAWSAWAPHHAQIEAWAARSQRPPEK